MSYEGNTLHLGRLVHDWGALDGKDVELSAKGLLRGLYVPGLSGFGKTKMLENIARQFIDQWFQTKCGFFLVDYHGTLYQNLLRWLALHKPSGRPVVLIDLTQKDWIVVCNLLRRRSGSDDLGVLAQDYVTLMLQGMGQKESGSTPRLNRLFNVTLRALMEAGGTLADSMAFLSYPNHHVRRAIASRITHQPTLQGLAEIEGYQKSEYAEMLESVQNRLYQCLAPEVFDCMFGVSHVSLDFSRALEEGWIVLCNLSVEGNLIADAQAALFGRLLLADLWQALRDRGKGREYGDRKPFYLLLDEFQLCLSPTIAREINEGRGYGIGSILAHQYPSQILDPSLPFAEQIYRAVLRAGNICTFRMEGEEDLDAVADRTFGTTYDADKVRHVFRTRKVMDYEEEIRTVRSWGRGHSDSASAATGYPTGRSKTFSYGTDAFGRIDANPKGMTDSQSEGQNFLDSVTQSSSFNEGELQQIIQKPIWGYEVTNIAYDKVEDQRRRAKRLLQGLEERQLICRLADMTAPVLLETPFVDETVSDYEVADYVKSTMQKWNFALEFNAAQKALKEQRERFFAGALGPAKVKIESPKRRLL